MRKQQTTRVNHPVIEAACHEKGKQNAMRANSSKSTAARQQALIVTTQAQCKVNRGKVTSGET